MQFATLMKLFKCINSTAFITLAHLVFCSFDFCSFYILHLVLRFMLIPRRAKIRTFQLVWHAKIPNPHSEKANILHCGLGSLRIL